MQRDQAHRTNELLERIAVALEKGNTTKAVELSGERNKELSAKSILDVVEKITDNYASQHPVDKLQGDKHDYDNKINHQDDEVGDDANNDYLIDLVQEMNKEQYIAFCQEMSYVNYDLKVVKHSLYELEYGECLGAIKQALAIIGDDADDPNLEVQLNQDEYTYEHHEPGNEYSDLIEYKSGIVNDSDYEIRKNACFYESILNTEGDNDYPEKLRTKKDCILDYVTNEFGSHGARYTDIIKFAYYLGSPNTFKYSNANRGYYAMAFAPRYGGFLIQGGKDQLVKGINNEGDERYFALSFVESATEYWKRIS